MARTRTAEEPASRRAIAPRPAADPPPASWTARLADAALVVAFLALTFLLGVFPLKDTDFWWHLRTGDWIREHWRVPTHDLYTFGAEDHLWIDLHWLFQIGLSWGYAHGGVVFLNLLKCVITCMALTLLVTARRRDWPVWAMLLAWLPALYILGGRMYVRPETLTLLYLAADLAILTRWNRFPKLAFLLPVVQVLWVNSQGLFVLGPLMIVLALIDAALTPGAFAPARKRWWRAILIASALTGAACIVNPYGLLGALYPLQLLGTMSDPIFKTTIAELKPLREFAAEAGIYNFQLIMYLVTLLLGGLSFLVPLLWRVSVRFAGDGPDEEPEPKKRRRKGKGKAPADLTAGWRVRPFRLGLYVVFSVLSLQATRNSHQFAAVVGAVTAWNVGEWLAAVRLRRWRRSGVDLNARALPRVVAMATIALAIAAVASGKVYALAGEGRTIGLGEEPLWFPRDAVKFAGQAGMPARFLCFHNGHAALFEYMNGDRQKVYTDARLEVMGPELYGEYIGLQNRIAEDRAGWEARLKEMGDPGILVDNVHAQTAPVSATLLLNPRYRCVWFDPIAAVFIPESSASRFPAVDFGARHFRPDPKTDPSGPSALLASGRALRYVGESLLMRRQGRRAAPLITLGLGYVRRSLVINPGAPEAWRLLGQLEWYREPPSGPEPTPRYRKPFDPTFDLASARSTYALRQALERYGDDFTTLSWLSMTYQARGMHEESVPLGLRLLTLHPTNKAQATVQAKLPYEVARAQAELGREPPADWKNLGELQARIDARLETGRARSAALLLESAYRQEGRPWDVTDRLATLWLHLGQPDRARDLWLSAASPPRPALVSARVAATYLVQGDFGEARRAYAEALAREPKLFEAAFGLAVLERDAGRAAEALAAAARAEDAAPTDVAKLAAKQVADEAGPYAKPGADGP